MRGKAAPVLLPKIRGRITPAYAGKRPYLLEQVRLFTDHPRLCGEKFRFLEISPAHEGSPPPMRGKGDICIAADSGVGITPAYAGKSLYNTSKVICIQDHPRLCGEKTVLHLHKVTSQGSPPPMRGKV